MRRILVALALGVAVAAPAPAGAQPETPFTQDPLGPIVDVTRHWRDYQPARVFCVSPNVFEASGDDGATATGRTPACRRSGFKPSAEALYVVRLRVPPLCGGCRRLFIDYSKIPEENAPPFYYARGHAYFRLQSPNPGYTVDPVAHSPNIKNFTNDKFFVPDGSPHEPLVRAFDLHGMGYTADTAHFAHTAAMGPWYAGPWYLSRDGRRTRGAYLDVDVMGTERFPDPALNEIGYQAGFNAGEPTCPDNVLFDGQYADGNYGYAGCADRFGGSSVGVDPYR